MQKVKRFFIPTLLLFGFIWMAFGPGDKYFQVAKNLDIFASLFKEVNGLYVDEIDPDEMVQTGIDAMLYSLDPYTTYIPEKDVDNFKTMTTGQYAGIGAYVVNIQDKVMITMPYDDYAADKAGLKIGDEVLSIDGIPVEGKSVSEISGLMKGKIKSRVDLLIKRYGTEDPMNFTLKREKIKIKNIPYYGVIEENIGYIKLADFTMGAGREVADAVEDLRSNGVQKIMLDLRGNPGGLLSEAVNVVNVFLPKGKIVVETKGRAEEWNRVYTTLNDPVDMNIPLIVLVNGESASASEIVAGAIQDYDRGILLGRKTYGKGLVQTSRSLPYNSQLKITTAKYYTPSGRCIQAIDYSHKDQYGNGTTIPDSARAEYLTMGGRRVYDGNGLNPDITVPQEELTPILAGLISEGYLFLYANHWYYHHKDQDFDKSNAEFNAFESWMKKQNYSYKTNVEEVIEELRNSAESEKYYADLKEEIAALEQAVEKDKLNDIKKYKETILELLEQEIKMRQHKMEGSITSTFDDDKDILTALDLLKKDNGVSDILTRN